MLPLHIPTVCLGTQTQLFPFYPNITSRSPDDASHTTTQQGWFLRWHLNHHSPMHNDHPRCVKCFQITNYFMIHAVPCHETATFDVKDKVPQTVQARLPSATHTWGDARLRSVPNMGPGFLLNKVPVFYNLSPYHSAFLRARKLCGTL